MANVLDFCEPGPLPSDEVVKPPIVSKANVQRCISKLSPYWIDEQLDQVVEMFQAHGLDLRGGNNARRGKNIETRNTKYEKTINY